MLNFTINPIKDIKSLVNLKISNILIVVTDNIILSEFANELYVELREVKETALYFVPDSENSKNLKTVELIWNQLIKLNSNRNTLLIAIGGGATIDTVAFCASTFMRGILFWSIPTTLLAMVDAAIGGKTAINLSSYKNYIGTFYSADKIWIDTNFIKSLNEIELRNGWAECLKHSLIYGRESWHKIQGVNWDLTDQSVNDYWTPLIIENSTFKEGIVEKDFLESNLREVLNAGHTLAHAIESYFINRNKFIPHGQAVAWGLLIESLVGNNITIIEFKTYSSDHWLKILENLVVNNFLRLPRFSKTEFEELLNYAKKDKKNRSNYIAASIINEPGQFKLQEKIDFEKVYSWLLQYDILSN
jgi:3-dehydroquinate synthase